METLVKRKPLLLLMIAVVVVAGITCYIVFGRSNNSHINQNALKVVTEIEKSAH